jgi:hypothetical protein
MKHVTCSAFLVILAASLSWGQIDGSQTPELIPDNIAYRLVLGSLQPNGDPLTARRQAAQIAQMGLSLDDATALLTNQAIFMSAWQALADLRVAGTIDYPTYQSELDALVTAARADFAAALTTDGMAKLDAYVQTSKTGMVVGMTAVAQ